MLQLLVPILIGCLLDPAQMKQANPLTKTLHAHALTTLTRIGTQYPQVNFDQSKLKGTSLFYFETEFTIVFSLIQEFKSLLNHLPDLRTKLESAARANQSSARNSKSGAINSAAEAKAAPTIKLKTDFSNFNMN